MSFPDNLFHTHHLVFDFQVSLGVTCKISTNWCTDWQL